MIVVNYYFSKDGKAFETEAIRKSYERNHKLDGFNKFVVTIYERASATKHDLPSDKLTVFRGGYLSSGVFRGVDFFKEEDAKDYETYSNEAELKWRDFLKFAMPEDMISYYEDSYLAELPGYGWNMWGEERPLPGTELTLLEKKGRGCTISYDVFDGENFRDSYHLDVLAWKPKTKDHPSNDPWVAYNKKRKLKCTEITLYKKLKSK